MDPHTDQSISRGTSVPLHQGPPDVFPDRKFVRVTEERDDGFVAFDFAISEPGLFVELLLTRAGFEEFCRLQNVVVLDATQNVIDCGDKSVPSSAWSWRLRDSAVAGL